MSAEVIASGLDCHLISDSGCGFPAPGAEIFLFDNIASFTIARLLVSMPSKMPCRSTSFCSTLLRMVGFLRTSC